MTPSGVPNSSINSICGLPKNLFRFFSSSFDSVSILRSMVLQEEIKKINKNIKIFYANYKPTNLKVFNLKKNYLIFCGLGNPEEFEKTLIKYKFKIKEKRFFADHYNFSNKDINEIKSIAKEKR